MLFKKALSELRFLVELWKMNLASALEYRANFITQSIGMLINDAIFFVFWLLFFECFKQVKGWGLQDMVLLFSIITTGFGAGLALFGNAMKMAEIIAQGRLDYYLVLPRNVLIHILASRSQISAYGDILFGVLSFFFFTGPISTEKTVLWLLASFLSGVVIVCSFSLFGCLSFFIGNATTLAGQATNALLILAVYPDTIFQGGVRFLMYTLLPAAFIGALPYKVVHNLDWQSLGFLAGGALFFALLLVVVFNMGLRRYESGSALNVNM